MIEPIEEDTWPLRAGEDIWRGDVLKKIGIALYPIRGDELTAVSDGKIEIVGAAKYSCRVGDYVSVEDRFRVVIACSDSHLTVEIRPIVSGD